MPPPVEPNRRESSTQKTPSVTPFRPSLRPPIAVLTVFDDGRQEGEQFRLRDGRFLIGRTEGDLIIPHDNMISSKHVEITRQQVGGQWRWVVTDLQSTNGLFVRVLRTVTGRSVGNPGRQGAVSVPGSGGASRTAPPTTFPSKKARNSTQAFGGEGGTPAIPSLVEVVGSGFGNRLVLTRSEYWIGTDRNCAIGRPNDPHCEARHARLFRDSKPSWQVEHNKSINGLWFRLPQVVAETTIQFQIGEQRCKLQLGG